MPSERHERSLPFGCPTKVFRARLFEVCRIRMGVRGFTPDAYVFDTDEKKLTLYEVVVTHDIDENKLWKLRALRDLLDAIGWTLTVRSGSCGEFDDVDLETGRADLSERCAEAVRLLDLTGHQRMRLL